MRLFAFLQYAALVIGIVAMAAGHFFGLAKGFNLGVFTIGAGCALAGLDALATRRMAFRPADEPYENYAGTPALIVGAMALAVGAAMIASAYLLDNDQWHATVNHLMRRPAPLLAAAGLFLIGFGVLALLNPQGRTNWLWRTLVYFPRSLAGLVVIVAGLAAIGLGAWEWFDPQASHAFMKALPGRLRNYIAQP
jgi:hypothetical protein